MSSVFLPPEQTRLVTICAHVDHGKTTLADNLIESNGIISERLAGTLRYLDSLEEEQRRGITMRASAIGLRHRYISPKQQEEPVDTIIHLIDNPGHSDFSTEVSSSLQCCDGCLIVIDAVEGMCARTHQVVREAYSHQLVPILVINKVDRLCTGLCLTPTEAYLRLRSLIETVNATCAAMLTSKNALEETEQEAGSLEREELHWTFEPQKGNVVFASALYGWGFTVPSLARSLFRGKALPIKPIMLKQCLFGDFKYKGEKLLKWKQDSAEEPLFAQFALQPIWEIYEGVATAASACGLDSSLFADGRIGDNQKGEYKSRIKADTPGMDQVLATMQQGSTGNQTGLPSTAGEMQTILTHVGASSEEGVLRSMLRRYRPLSDTVLGAIYELLPSPVLAASEVRPRALALTTDETLQTQSSFLKIKKAVKTCDVSKDAPTVAHICKCMAVDRANIRDPHLSDENTSVIMGMARVLSGCLKTGDEYYVMGPKHKAADKKRKRQVRLYLLMGSSFVLVDEVPAGHLCAIQNLEDLQLKTATLCDSPDGMPLRGFDNRIRPLVKVNVETIDPADTYALEQGLVKLSLADSAVEVTATAKGERILACLGEIHLEQSILDLKKLYCGKDVELRISDPIVEFGETTDWFDDELDFRSFLSNTCPALRQCTISPYNEEEGLEFAHRGRSRAILSGRFAAISLRVVPLKPSVHSALMEKKVIEGGEDDIVQLGKALGLANINMNAASVLQILISSLCSIDKSGNALVESKTLAEGRSVRGVTSENGEVYMPNGGAGVLEHTHDADSSADESTFKAYDAVKAQITECGFLADSNPSDSTLQDAGATSIWKDEMRGSLVAGFQTAVRAGPICEEPVRGVLVVLEGLEVAVESSPDLQFKTAKLLTSGMVVAAIRAGIRSCLITRPIRLMEKYLRLTLHSSLSGLGPLYAVLSKRRGKVLDDAMVDGTDLLEISALLPHAESFGLAPELFRQSSGEVTAPELVFSHWERFEQDPFWVPTSFEEREDFGENLQNGDVSTGVDNTAVNYIRKVRARKGLVVDSSRTVMSAEKQRTMKR
jgi:ribosome assembly protein 1